MTFTHEIQTLTQNGLWRREDVRVEGRVENTGNVSRQLQVLQLVVSDRYIRGSGGGKGEGRWVSE